MLKVKKAIYLHDYVLQIQFNNGKIVEVDFAELVAENSFYLKPLRNLTFFKRVAVDEFGYAICWPNGADFSPDVLYSMGKKVRIRKSSPSKRKIIHRKTISKK
jgi:hypothetical protein